MSIFATFCLVFADLRREIFAGNETFAFFFFFFSSCPREEPEGGFEGIARILSKGVLVFSGLRKVVVRREIKDRARYSFYSWRWSIVSERKVETRVLNRRCKFRSNM